jgi:geranylgeranyl pyrophosphate synthase
MSQAALDLSKRPLLSELLDEHFEADSLQSTVGSEAEGVPWACWSTALYTPLDDFLSRPGKGFRSRLVAAGYELAGGNAMPRELPAIVESLHAGSLIIDDIEDESAYRRGASALHIGYGTATALNAGSFLYFWPHELLQRMQLHPTQELAMRRAIDRTMFAAHHGQALDLAVRIAELPQRDAYPVVRATTLLKTGALGRLAMELGAIAADGSAEVVRAAAQFGQNLGLGLQMADDWGGIVSEARCHKGHEDLIFSRPTWPWAWLSRSLDAHSYARLLRLSRQVSQRDAHPEALAEELRAQLEADAPQTIHTTLSEALSNLRQVTGKHHVIEHLKAQLETLEASYV